jgi:hypothetical protein
MKIFRFDSQVGKNIDRHNSPGFVLARVLHLFDEAAVNCAHLGSGGHIEYHQATIPQLFLGVQGNGWVRGASAPKTSIKAGKGAFWE